jgi:hypothetical protein
MFLHSLERRSQERRSYWARAPSDCLDSFPGGIISRLPCPFDIPKEGAMNDGAAAHTLDLRFELPSRLSPSFRRTDD